MSNIVKKIYSISPFIIKKVFANIEAKRRNIYRRGKKYKKYYDEINIQKSLIANNTEKQLEKLNILLEYAYENIEFYKTLKNKTLLKSINEIDKLPLTDKHLMMKNIDLFLSNKQGLWESKTSGSTGTPFAFYRDKQSMQYEYAIYDRFYEYVVKKDKFIKGRISGVNVLNVNSNKPPFWLYIKEFNQLQCSSYHIDKNTYKYYLDAFDKYNVELGTGYSKSWLFLSQFMEEGRCRFDKLRGVITDSEGMTVDEKHLIENMFKCPVYPTYGLGEVGLVAVECKYNHYHIFTDRCIVEIVNEEGKTIENGQIGEIVVTDLNSFNAPFIRYKTGDVASLNDKPCECGWETPYLQELIGRVDDYILTPSGKKIGRLSHIAKHAIGILGMQILQNSKKDVEIHVLPSIDFNEGSMIDVINTAKDLLGRDMDVSWKKVNELEKNNAGKIRYVIRRIN